MKRRTFLRALVALPVAAAAAPLLKLVPEAEPVWGHIVTPNYDAFVEKIWAECGNDTGEWFWYLHPEQARAIEALAFEPIAPKLRDLPLIQDPLCPPDRLYLRRIG